MTDKVQLIREEIERLEVYPQSRGFIKHMIAFIDSLSEEHVNEEEIEALNSVRYLNPALDSLYLKLKEL